MNRIQINVK